MVNYVVDVKELTMAFYVGTLKEINGVLNRDFKHSQGSTYR